MTFKEIQESLIGKEMHIRYKDGDRKVYTIADVKRGDGEQSTECSRVELTMKEKFNSINWDWYDFLATLAFFVKDERSFDKASVNAAAFMQHYKEHYAFQLAGNFKDRDKILNQNLVKK